MIINRVFLLFLAGGILFSGIVMILAAVFKKNRLIKYCPSLLLFLFMAYAIFRASSNTEGMEDLGYIALAMLAFSAGLMSVITAAVIDILKMIETKKKEKYNNE